jgi:RNase P subunit RPR2
MTVNKDNKMIQKDLNGCIVPKELLGCDNTDCENRLITPKTKEVRMKQEFEGGTVNWCDDCIERDKDFIQVCEYCESTERESWKMSVYHPFDTEPSFEGYVCDYCMDDFYYCEGCDRYIFENNGYRNNVRYNDKSETMICVKCLQNEWFEMGMPNFKDADWFNDADLLKHGYKKYKSYFCRSEQSYKYAEQDFIKLQEFDNLVIVSIERSGMGFEHTIALWKKPMDLLNKIYYVL